MTNFIHSAALLFVLLNPFLLIVYLANLVREMERPQFMKVLIRAGIIASVVFCSFAILGDAIFSNLIRAQFASFQIFGGIVFLLIGIQFVFKGPGAIAILRGEPQHLAGAIAMPLLVGPATISASVVIGQRLDPLSACICVVSAVAMSIFLILALKSLHDYVRPINEPLVHRYIEIAGRITALFVGTISVEMIMKGVQSWADTF